MFILQVGGLGDVVTGLGKSLQKRGHLVEIVLPKYDCMQSDLIRDFRVRSFFVIWAHHQKKMGFMNNL